MNRIIGMKLFIADDIPAWGCLGLPSESFQVLISNRSSSDNFRVASWTAAAAVVGPPISATRTPSRQLVGPGPSSWPCSDSPAASQAADHDPRMPEDSVPPRAAAWRLVVELGCSCNGSRHWHATCRWIFLHEASSVRVRTSSEDSEPGWSSEPESHCPIVSESRSARSRSRLPAPSVTIMAFKLLDDQVPR